MGVKELVREEEAEDKGEAVDRSIPFVFPSPSLSEID
jgi:hypothetical protein